MINKRHYFFVTFLCIAASQQLHAMKNNVLISEPTILTKLTVIKEPYTALYLTQHHALINGRKQCSIVDIRTNQEVKRIFERNGWHSEIAVHPNRTHFALSHHYDGCNQKIIIYNTKTYEPENTFDWHGATIMPLHFSPLDKTIVLGRGNHANPVILNYETKDTTIIDIKEAQREKEDTDIHYPAISLHPTEPFMCLAWENIYIINLKTLKTKKLDGTKVSNVYHDFCEYTPDGLFIVRGTTRAINIINLNSLTNQGLMGTGTECRKQYLTGKKCFSNIAIHPNSKILLTLSRSSGSESNILHYWKIHPCKLISTIAAPSASRICRAISLSFSSNGAKLLLVLNGECSELAVPFDALYKDLTKENCVFAYWMLKNYLHEGKPLPHDIPLFFINNLLERSQY